jgi:NAD(P)-dependent dehydrogenase (short-subunit alcohol dehydrogenase family)
VNAVHGAKGLTALNDGGSIILNGSVASVKGTAAFGVYAASKAAIRSFVRRVQFLKRCGMTA